MEGFPTLGPLLAPVVPVLFAPVFPVGTKPTFEQLANFKSRYENAEYVESNERFADFEIREGERKER
ncbi:hypothetical protein P4240_27135, partial [Bacillus thuringiensis]|nr:hypothetical protein [Bacillus thuringiensis]